MIALCCHHKCAWEPYIGNDVTNKGRPNMQDHEFFEMELGFNKEEFRYLCSMSSWAIDGSEQLLEEQEPATKRIKEGELNLESLVSYQALPVTLKKQYGFKAKRLIGM
jgi:hypothetical protein